MQKNAAYARQNKMHNPTLPPNMGAAAKPLPSNGIQRQGSNQNGIPEGSAKAASALECALKDYKYKKSFDAPALVRNALSKIPSGLSERMEEYFTYLLADGFSPPLLGLRLKWANAHKNWPPGLVDAADSIRPEDKKTLERFDFALKAWGKRFSRQKQASATPDWHGRKNETYAKKNRVLAEHYPEYPDYRY